MCYTCMGSNNEDCNRQGSKPCPSYSDACAVVVGHDSESNRDSVVVFASLFDLTSYTGPCLFLDLCVVYMSVIVLNGRQAAVWRHFSVSRGLGRLRE